MKKFFIFVFIVFSLFFVGNSKAFAETVLDCTYSLNYGVNANEKIDVKVNVSEKGKASLDEGEYFNLAHRSLTLKNGKQFANYMYSKSDDELLHSVCPNLFYCKNPGEYNDILSYNANKCSNGSDGISVPGTLNSYSLNVPDDQSEDICTLYITNKEDGSFASELFTGGDFQYAIHFYLNDKGDKVFTVSTNMVQGGDEQISAETPYDGEASLRNLQFHVKEGLEDYWEDEETCKNTEAYFKKNSEYRYEITNEKPDDYESGSPDDSDGHEHSRASEPRGQSDDFTPGELCKDGACDISLSGFCSNPPVKATLRFLGVLLVIAKILVPIIIIAVGVISLVRAIIAGKEDETKKYIYSVIKRVLVGVVIFLLPGIIDFVFDTVSGVVGAQNSSVSTCEACILDVDNCK